MYIPVVLMASMSPLNLSLTQACQSARKTMTLVLASSIRRSCKARTFHPMCALLVSKLSTQSNQASSNVLKNDREGEVGNFQKSKDKDSKLALEFTLTFVDCDATTPVSGKDSGTTQTLQIPVCFCGIHNPKRERSFYGLYPGACHIDKEVMRVPPLNDPKLK